MADDTLRFGDYLLDCRGRALYYRRAFVPMQGKPLHVLIYLAAHAGQAVSKDELLKNVWHDEQRSRNCVEETVGRIRRFLDDTDKPHRIIETDYSNGYVFIPEVTPAARSEIPSSLRHRSFSTTYVVQPATIPDISWAAKLAENVYSGDDIIPEPLMLAWYDKNPTGFSIVRSSLGAPAGNLDLLPIKPEVMKGFVAGSMIERDISADCLYQSSEHQLVSDLYVESLVCVSDAKSPRPRSNPFAAAQVLSEFELILRRICDPSHLRRIYAIAASNPGRRLLAHLGFEICTGKHQRKDKHDLYVAQYTELAKRLVEFFGDGRRDETAMKLLDEAEDEERGL